MALSKQEKAWQAESDAHSLADAEAIKSDTKRLAEAKKAAKRISTEEQARAKEMQAKAQQMKRLASKKAPVKAKAKPRVSTTSSRTSSRTSPRKRR